MLYSYQGQYPQPLPHRIRLSSGLTRTDSTSFTLEEIADAGYVEVSNPPIPGSSEVVEWLNGNWVVRNKTAEELQVEKQAFIDYVVQATQERLDNFAKTRNYDGILSCCSYHNSTNTKFATEAAYCIQLRTDTWTTLYQILNEVESGTRPTPQGFSDIEADLPPLQWTN